MRVNLQAGPGAKGTTGVREYSRQEKEGDYTSRAEWGEGTLRRDSLPHYSINSVRAEACCPYSLLCW